MNTISATQPPKSTNKSTPTDENTLGQYIPLIYHYNMLQDEARVGAFREAIDQLVRPGMHVVELGGGTGILSSFAANRGARVTCVERNPELVATARGFLQDNGLSEIVTVVEADAAKFIPDSPVDVVICEMLHVGLLREKQASVIAAFKKNYRAKFTTRMGGTSEFPIFIPEVSILMVQPIDHSFDFRGYHAPVIMFQDPGAEQPRTQPLADLEPYASLSYREAFPQRFEFDQDLEILRGGYLNAVRLVTQNVLAIDEAKSRAVTWPNQNMVLPLDCPRDVQAGETVRLKLDYAAGASIDDFQATLRIG